MTIQEIKNHLDKIQISDLHPRYNFMNGYGSTPIADLQYESVAKSNILHNGQTFGFHEPINRFDISSHVINRLSDLLKKFFKNYLVSGSIITAVGNIPINIFSRSLIDIKISLGSASAAESLQELVEDTNSGYNYCEFLEGINISSDADFGDFVVSPTNSSFDILPSKTFRTVGNELIIDRSIIKFNRQFKTSLYLPEWLNQESYQSKMKELSHDDLQKISDGFYSGKYLIYDKSDVFFHEHNNNYYLDLLCYVFSVHFQKSILNTWRFDCPENTLLRMCCDFIPNYQKNNRPIFDMDNITVGRTNPIDVSDKDIHDILDFYGKISNMCEKYNDKERFIKSMLHYNNIACNSDMILKVQELVNSFTCLVGGNLSFSKIFEKYIPDFIANNRKDKKSMIDDLNKLRKYRNAQPHPDKVKLKFIVDGVGEPIWQNCMEYYKRLILKCVQQNGLCPS